MCIEENTITTAMLEKIAEEMKQQRDEIERLREALRGVIRVPDKAALDAARVALGEGE